MVLIILTILHYGDSDVEQLGKKIESSRQLSILSRGAFSLTSAIVLLKFESNPKSSLMSTIVKILFRMIESQKFVMTNLRNGIDYLKNTCKDVGNGKEMNKMNMTTSLSSTSSPGEVIMNGCQWAEWAPFSVCSKTCGGGRKVMMMTMMMMRRITEIR